MANDFLQGELKKITQDSRWEFPLNNAMAAAYLLAHYKGENLKVFDMTKRSALCDFNVIATAQNTMQARSMADEIAAQFRALGTTVRSMEGYGSADWILIDTGDVIVHIFQDSTREVYDLDTVFDGAPQASIPSEFYFSGSTPKSAEENLKGYF